MGFGVDSDYDGVWILIFCHGFLFFWIRMVGFWIPIGWTLDSKGFRLDSDWLVWFDMVAVWHGGDSGGWCLVVVGHCGGSVWSSLVWWVCYCYVLCSLCWFDLK